MSNQTSTKPQKRKRSADNPSKIEPAIKKIRRSKSSKLEKGSIETNRKKRKSNKSSRKLNYTIGNFFEKDKSYFKSGSEVNINISCKNIIPVKNIKMEVTSSTSTGFDGLSIKIINSKKFKMLRDLRVFLDRTVVDNYFRKKNSKNNSQKTLDQFFNLKVISRQNPTIDNKAILPSIPKKQEDFDLRQLCKIDKKNLERVSISLKDLMLLCNVKVYLKKLHLHPIDGFNKKNDTTSSTNNIDNCKAIKKFDHHEPEDCFKTEIVDDTINENLARIKIEDVSSNFTIKTDENSMQMEVSEESWENKYSPNFSELDMVQRNMMKVTDAISEMSNDRLLSTYDECPEVPMDVEMDTNEIIENVPDTLYANFANSGSSFNSSRYSWPVSDESGIFISDESINFNDMSNKFVVNNSFSGLDSHKE